MDDIISLKRYHFEVLSLIAIDISFLHSLHRITYMIPRSEFSFSLRVLVICTLTLSLSLPPFSQVIDSLRFFRSWVVSLNA
jgi:hypothetical protein